MAMEPALKGKGTRAAMERSKGKGGRCCGNLGGRLVWFGFC